MSTPSVLPVAGGLHVAQRGAAASLEPGLRVAERAPVSLPHEGGQEALTAQGEVWRRTWALNDRLVIDFVSLVSVEVHDDGRVVFDRPLKADMEQHLLLDHVLPLVLARRGHAVLHGAVISAGGRAAVLLGPTGSGKSTLTAYAWQHGWTVGGDDGAVILWGPPVSVEPTYATVRLTPGAASMLDIIPDEGSEVVGKRRLHGRGDQSFIQRPVELALIAVLQATTDEDAGFTRLRGVDAHAALFASAFHLELGGGQALRDMVARLGCLIEQVTVGRLTVPRGVTGLQGAETALRDAMTTAS